MKIYYHADDLGQNIEQSRPFLECHEDGVLNSLALMANSPKATECYDLVRDLVDCGEIRPTVHLNFVEGPALSDKADVPDLVDERGYLNLGFLRACQMGFAGKKNKMNCKKQIKSEIRLQINKALEIFRGEKEELPKWGIDSHMHYHMIPIVWRSLCEVIKEDHLSPSWIRLSKDPISPLITTPSIWKKLKPINIIKWMILKMIGPSKSKVESLGVTVPVFFGMFFTLQMEKEVVSKLHAKYEKIAKKQGRDLELMFHPGYCKNREETLDPTKEDFWKPNSSDFRIKEQETLKTI